MKFRLLPIIMFVASAHFYGQVTPQDSTQVNTSVQAGNQTGTYTLKDIVVDGVKNIHRLRSLDLQDYRKVRR